MGALAAALAGRKRGDVRRAVKLARTLPQRAAMKELLALFRSRGTRDARTNALWVASEIAEPRDGKTFAALLRHRDALVQSIAIDGICRARHVAALPALAAIVNASQHPGRLAATFGMMEIGPARGMTALKGYLHARDPRIREAAAHGIRLHYEGTRIPPALEQCTRDRDKRVVAAAKHAMRVIVARRSIDYG